MSVITEEIVWKYFQHHEENYWSWENVEPCNLDSKKQIISAAAVMESQNVFSLLLLAAAVIQHRAYVMKIHTYALS